MDTNALLEYVNKNKKNIKRKIEKPISQSSFNRAFDNIAKNWKVDSQKNIESKNLTKKDIHNISSNEDVQKEEKNGNAVMKKYNYTILQGYQKAVMETIFNVTDNIEGYVSPKLGLSFLSSKSGVFKQSVKQAVKELKKKKIILTKDFKKGNSGWVRYEINRDIYNEMSHIFNNKQDREVNVESEILKKSEIEQEIIIPHNIKEIGFKENHFKQLMKHKHLTFEKIQKSLEHFSFDLENKELKVKTNPLNFFMGAMRGREYISGKFIEEENKEQILYRQEIRKIMKQEEEENKKIAAWLFDKWIEETDKEEVLKRVPIKYGKNGLLTLCYLEGMHAKHVQEYFEKYEREAFEKVIESRMPRSVQLKLAKVREEKEKIKGKKDFHPPLKRSANDVTFQLVTS